MRRKRIIIGALTVFIVGAAAALVQRNGARRMRENGPQVVRPVSVTRNLDGRTQKIVASLRHEIAQLQPPAERDTEVAAGRELAQAFAAIHAYHDYFDKDRVFTEVIGEVSEVPLAIAAAKRLLTDPRYLAEACGKDQALSRVYAIKMLRQRALAGSSEDLAEVTRDLAQSLERDGELVKGQYRDLEDLVRVSLEANYDRADVVNRPEEIAAVLAGRGPGHGASRAELAEAVGHAYYTRLLALGVEQVERDSIAQRLRLALAGQRT